MGRWRSSPPCVCSGGEALTRTVDPTVEGPPRRRPERPRILKQTPAEDILTAMSARGDGTHRITRKDQLEALASPVRLAIVDVFHARGKCSISEIAGALDVSPNSLYYHVNMLTEVGLLVEDSVRKGKRRSETVYRLIRPRIEMVYDPDIEGSSESLARAAASMLRMTERDAKAALERGDIIDDGPMRNYHVGRGKVRLSPKGLERLNKLLGQMEDLLHRESRRREGKTYAITMALVPLLQPGDNGRE